MCLFPQHGGDADGRDQCHNVVVLRRPLHRRNSTTLWEDGGRLRGLDEAAVLVALEGHAPPSSRRCTLITVTADHGLPVGVGTPRRLSSVAMPRADRWDSSVKTGRSFSVRALAASTILTVLGRMPPSFLPWALKAAIVHPWYAGRSCGAVSRPERRKCVG